MSSLQLTGGKAFSRLRYWVVAMLLLAMSLSHAACLAEDPGSTYYGRVASPRNQEFRWSDGGLPQIFDPAFAAAPPDTDLIRAIFEGLTDYDPQTLQPVPAVATRWESTRDGRVWTFYLREDARWSNGEQVTANDFIQSWARTAKLGDLVPHTELLQNIQGAAKAAGPLTQLSRQQDRKAIVDDKNVAGRKRSAFGAEALGKHVLRVRLERPDLNFPSLVAHPVFRPVKVGENPLERIEPNMLVSNGAFLLSKADTEQVLLQRADNYWGRGAVTLERVSFVATMNPEAALAAYREGEIDAVTNAAFEPLAIKLLAPYQDFRRATYGALTYYSFNTAREPFDDVRVREALAIAIDRDRISQDEMGGATEPAKRFLPDEMTDSDQPVIGKADALERDVNRAKQLLAAAGYPDGRGFPKIRLLINRNEQQRIVSQSVAAMWRSALNVETEIIIKTWDEYEAAVRSGDYDVVRRGVVMQTTDELTNIRMIFRQPATANSTETTTESTTNVAEAGKGESLANSKEPIESEEQALRQLKAFPIYFASSYALVKPYVVGFHANLLDAPSLKTVRIDPTWTEKKGR